LINLERKFIPETEKYFTKTNVQSKLLLMKEGTEDGSSVALQACKPALSRQITTNCYSFQICGFDGGKSLDCDTI
jgi:hypothetical protein